MHNRPRKQPMEINNIPGSVVPTTCAAAQYAIPVLMLRSLSKVAVNHD